ncbi:hypothetical protein QTP88_029214 [Uroleucon formosanum]
MVCLDVANAFNSVSWVRIEEALVEKNVPAYLVLILRSYLSDRSLIYGENQRRAITSGVPQGSVLGPMLWNIMYDDLLRTEMPGNIPDISSSTVIAFADDVAVLATYDDTARSGNEPVIGGSGEPRFLLENTQLTLKEHVRYLGVEFSSKLGFGKHLECAAVKAKKTITSLSRLMPNIGGPKQRKRQLLMTVAQSQMLYAAPVWAPALRFEKNIRTLSSPQRLMAIRVACAYRTVSTNAINVVASMLPLKQMASERCAIYAAKQNGLTPPTKRELREQSIREWQKEWQASDTGTWTKRLIPDLQPWVTRSFGTLNYHLTQLLTGHGCFGEKLSKFKRRDTSVCYDCREPVDSAEHAFFDCDRWWKLRRELEVKTNKDFTPETAVKTILESKKNWDKVTGYVVHVLKTREEDERQRKRHQQLIA